MTSRRSCRSGHIAQPSRSAATVSTPPDIAVAAFPVVQWPSLSLMMAPSPRVPRPRMAPTPATFFAAVLLDASWSACSDTKGSDLVSSASRAASSTKTGSGGWTGTQAHSAALAVVAGAVFSDSILPPAALGDAGGVVVVDTGAAGFSSARAGDARKATRSAISRVCVSGRSLEHPDPCRAMTPQNRLSWPIMLALIPHLAFWRNVRVN